LGNLPEIQRKGILKFYLDSWQEFGDIFYFRIGPKVINVVTNPAHIEQILVENHRLYRKGESYGKLKLLLGEGLVTSDGELWQRQRRLMQPFFTENKIKLFGVTMSDAIQEMLERWQTHAQKNIALEIMAEMERLAMSIIGRTMLSVDTGDRNTEIAQAIKTSLTSIGRDQLNFLISPYLSPLLLTVHLKKREIIPINLSIN
jgi:cytochrome P450